jgi:gamma-tubulin complex component 5
MDDDEDDTVSSLDSDFGYGVSPRPPPVSVHVDGTHAGQGSMGWKKERPDKRTYEHRKDVEEMQARQYWRPEWRTDVSLTRPFDLGDASTLG